MLSSKKVIIACIYLSMLYRVRKSLLDRVTTLYYTASRHLDPPTILDSFVQDGY